MALPQFPWLLAYLLPVRVVFSVKRCLHPIQLALPLTDLSEVHVLPISLTCSCTNGGDYDRRNKLVFDSLQCLLSQQTASRPLETSPLEAPQVTHQLH